MRVWFSTALSLPGKKPEPPVRELLSVAESVDAVLHEMDLSRKARSSQEENGQQDGRHSEACYRNR